MANSKLSQLTETLSPASTDELYINSGGVSKKTTISNIVSGIPAIGTNTAHGTSTANPHSVTKAQVGLANVDNTADIDKPVSTAQQAAIDAVGGGGGSSVFGSELMIIKQINGTHIFTHGVFSYLQFHTTADVDVNNNHSAIDNTKPYLVPATGTYQIILYIKCYAVAMPSVSRYFRIAIAGNSNPSANIQCEHFINPNGHDSDFTYTAVVGMNAGDFPYVSIYNVTGKNIYIYGSGGSNTDSNRTRLTIFRIN